MSSALPEIPQAALDLVGWRFVHFKGGLYRVTSIARDSKTCKPVVVYQSLDRPTEPPWLRVFDGEDDAWQTTVRNDKGELVSRFYMVGPHGPTIQTRY